ncbi:hypothetical protein Tco_1253724 [Tanacetum coccineum]|uniref:Uncharacterized protein n=1 Tax=Tanacetum coccineum TaxID=301880 RepID=A0ABQ5BAE9_9ASTR
MPTFTQPLTHNKLSHNQIHLSSSQPAVHFQQTQPTQTNQTGQQYPNNVQSQQFQQEQSKELEKIERKYKLFCPLVSLDEHRCCTKGAIRRALPSSWSQVYLALKTRGGLESMSFDDMYNKLKSLELDNEPDQDMIYEDFDQEFNVKTVDDKARKQTVRFEKVNGLMALTHADKGGAGRNTEAAVKEMHAVLPPSTRNFICLSPYKTDIEKHSDKSSTQTNAPVIQAQDQDQRFSHLLLYQDFARGKILSPCKSKAASVPKLVVGKSQHLLPAGVDQIRARSREAMSNLEVENGKIYQEKAP